MSTPSGLLSSLVRRWDDFWFREIDRSVYALLRIAFGAVGLGSQIGLLPIDTFWLPGGLIPVPEPGSLQARVFDAGLGSIAGAALFTALLLAQLCMLVGYRTSVAVVVSWLGWVVQSFWNTLPLAGGNEVLGIALFCLIWADCSGYPSVDSWRTSQGGSFTPKLGLIWPLQLIRIQVAFIYVNSAFWKLLGPTWRDGTTLHYVLNLNTFQRFPYALPLWAEPLATMGTYFTLFWELTFPLMLLNRRTRTFAIVAGIGVHVGLWILLELGPFSWVMLASYLAFLEPDRVAAWLARWNNQVRAPVADPLTQK